MGGAEAVPVVREGISSSLKRIRKDGIRVLGAHQSGRPYWEADLTGPLALVLGGESKGLSSTLLGKCDEVVGIPLEGDLESLNVSVSAGILLFERIRQQRSGQG
jgi:23S rRNA (guanosine2251-2'-O)-methyltransferase